MKSPPSSSRRKACGLLGSAALIPLATLAGCAGTALGPSSSSSSSPPSPARTGSSPAASNTGTGTSTNAITRSTQEAAYRLINRLSWGANDSEFERCLSMGLQAYITRQLEANDEPLPEAAERQIQALSIQQRSLPELHAQAQAHRKASTEAATEEERKAAGEALQREMNRQAREAATRHVLRALYSPAQLREHMSWFWFNHFNVHQYKLQVRVLLADYEERALRPQALGSFRQMLGAATRHPAMLQYLDNWQSSANRINENHARELLELHTLGVDGGYTQKDVQELARVLTGHGVNFTDAAPRLKPEWQSLYRRSGFYEFNPARHDFGDKVVLGRSIRGRGADELDEVLDLLAAHPSTARFISLKMARFLLSDDPPPELVQKMARAFASGAGGVSVAGGQIAAALEVLLRSPEFIAEDVVEPSAPSPSQASGLGEGRSMGRSLGPSKGKFKDPMHFVISALRAAYDDRVISNPAPILGWLNALGQAPYNRQTPDGYPDKAGAWNGSGQMATRFDIARAIGSGPAGLLKGFPQLSRPIYYQVLRHSLREATRQALEQAASPQEWNVLYLSSPEFMHR